MVKKVGTSRGETLRGTSGADTLLGLGGNDVLVGGAGADTLNGGIGNDTIKAGAGNDRITAGQGKDTVYGGAGTDTVVLNGNFADAVITEVNGGYKIVLNGATTIVRSVEFVEFSDGTVAANKLINVDPTVDATQTKNGSEDVVVTGTVTASDANGDSLSFAVASSGPGAPAHGAVTIDASGNFTYTPASNYNGTDTFTVTVTDGNGGTATQVVTVNLAAVNDAPVVSGIDASAVLVDGGATSTATPLFANFAVSDIDSTLGAGTVVSVTSDTWADSFSFDGDGTASTGVEQVANLVLVNGVGYGSVTTSNYGITITFNSAATPAIIQQVIRALELDANGSGTRDISITVTDAGGVTSDAVTSSVTVLATDGDATLSVTDAQEIVALSSNATTVASGASVNYVQTVGIGNVDDVTLTISVDGDFDTTDSLTLSTSVPTHNGEVAVIAGYLIYRAGGQNYNIGTVTGGTNGQPLVVTLSDDNTDGYLDDEDFDDALAAVITQVKFDAADAGTDGVRNIEFLINGVGSDEATGTASVVVTDGGQINLTADSDTVTAGTQGDTNATFTAAGTPVDPDGINVFNAAVGTLTAEDSFAGGTGATDILNVELAASVGNPTIGRVETFNIATDGTSSLDLANVTNDNGHTMQINVEGDYDLTLTSVGSTFGEIDASELDADIDITTVAGKSLSVVAAQGTTTVNADDSATQATITIDGSSAGTKIILDGNADFVLTGNISAIVDASAATDSVTISNIAGAGSRTVTAGSSDLTISDSDISASLTVAAAAMGDTATLSVAGEANLTVSAMSALVADLDLTGYTGETASIALGNAGGDGAIAITLGAFANTADSNPEFAITSSTALDTVTIDATAATTKNGSGPTAGVDVNENVDIALAGDATFVVNGLTADVNAAAATGTVTLNVLAAADIDVVAGTGNTNINGAADMVSIAASNLGAGDTITIGTLADDFDGDINVSVFGAGTLDAIYLDGDLTVSGDDDESALIKLGASVDSAIITVSEGSTSSSDYLTVNAAAYANTLTLTGAGEVSVTGFYSTIDANADLDSLVAGAEEMTGGLDVTLAANANATIIGGDNSSIVVTSGDADGIDVGSALDGTRSTITINAAAMAADTNIVINDSTGVPNFNANVVITGVLGDAAESATDIDLSGSVESASTATVTITTGNLGSDALDIELGSSKTVSITGTSGTINIDATAAAAADFDGNVATDNTNVQLTLAGTSTYVVTNSTADILASAATGNISVTALAGSQSITTGSGNDVINAGDGDDTIVAGNGNNDITGGVGNDVITAGTGADTFIFALGDSNYGVDTRDAINGFEINKDTIDLSGYVDDNGTPANLADDIDLVTSMSDLQISIGSTSTVITIDSDNSGTFTAADEQIELKGNYVGQSFSASDFQF